MSGVQVLYNVIYGETDRHLDADQTKITHRDVSLPRP